jgi:hypothetical protein
MTVPAAPTISTRTATLPGYIGKFVVDGDVYKQIAIVE